MGHAPFLAPFFNGMYKGLRYFGVIDKVNPAEAHLFLVPGLVGFMVDDGGYTSYDFIILVSKKVIGFAKFESGIFLLVEGIEHIIVEIGHRIRIVFV